MIRIPRRTHDIATLSLVVAVFIAHAWWVFARGNTGSLLPGWMGKAIFPMLPIVPAWLLLVRRQPLSPERRAELRETMDPDETPMAMRIAAILIALCFLIRWLAQTLPELMGGDDQTVATGTLVFSAVVHVALLGGFIYAMWRGIVVFRYIALFLLWFEFPSIGTILGLMSANLASGFPMLRGDDAGGQLWGALVGMIAAGTFVVSYFMLTSEEVTYWCLCKWIERQKRHAESLNESLLQGVPALSEAKDEAIAKLAELETPDPENAHSEG